MSANPRDSGWSWVKAVGLCSVGKVFDELKLDLKRDVEERNGLLTAAEPYKFTSTPRNGDVIVSLDGNNRHHSVTFSMHTQGITVRSDDGTTFEASLTLNDEGECRYRVNGQECEPWQMRKRALWKLFFETA
jgi:hypothetical protein